MFKITESEMVAYLDWEVSAFRRSMTANHFPGPVCIVLEMFENYAFAVLLGDHSPTQNFHLPFPAKLPIKTGNND